MAIKKNVNTLALMERRGTITAAQRQAGERFRAVFLVAHHDALRSRNLDVLRSGNAARTGCGAALPTLPAREAVRRAVEHLGGEHSQAASVLLHVIGMEQTVKEWAAGHNRSQETAAGMLVAVLSVIERGIH